MSYFPNYAADRSWPNSALRRRALVGPIPTVGIALQSGLEGATQRSRGHNLAPRGPRFHVFVSYSYPSTSFVSHHEHRCAQHNELRIAGVSADA